MIRELKEEFNSSKKVSLEDFIKSQENELKDKYKLPEVLFYLNIQSLFEELNQTSEYFDLKTKQAHEEDALFDSFNQD